MSIFEYIKSKKEAFKTGRLELLKNRAETLEKIAKEKDKEKQEIEKYNKAMNEVLKRQEKAKATISETNRLQHPLIFKMKDNVKAKFDKAQKEKTTNSMFGNNNIGSSQNLWTQSNSKSPDWYSTSSNNSLFTSLGTTRQPKKRTGKNIIIKLK